MTCPSCDTKLKVPDELAGSGKLLKCPKCAEKIPLAGSKGPQRAKQKESGLLGETSWMLRIKERLFLSAYYDRHYDLYRPGTKDRVGVIDEKPATWVKILRGFPNMWRILPNKWECRDSDGKTLLFTAHYNGLSLRKKIDVHDPQGQLVASFALKLFSLVTNFNVYGANNEKIGDFRLRMADFKNGKPPRVGLMLGDVEHGSVTGEEEMEQVRLFKEQKVGFKTSVMPQKAGLHIAMNPEVAATPRVKIQLIAAALVLRLFGSHKIFQST
jgi:hypothetical protein